MEIMRSPERAVDRKLGEAARADRHPAGHFLRGPFRKQDTRAAQQQAMLLGQVRRAIRFEIRFHLRA